MASIPFPVGPVEEDGPGGSSLEGQTTSGASRAECQQSTRAACLAAIVAAKKFSWS